MPHTYATGSPLFASGPDHRIVCWNDAAEELTGIPAAEALGRPCWEVIAGRDDQGGLVCHRGCSRARLASQGWPLRTLRMHVRTATGDRRAMAFETIAAVGAGESAFIHLMSPDEQAAQASSPEAELGPRPRLTPRQTDVLRLLGDGISARDIAERLRLSEATARNHIRAILLALGAHSQLEAVSRARCYGLV